MKFVGCGGDCSRRSLQFWVTILWLLLHGWMIPSGESRRNVDEDGYVREEVELNRNDFDGGSSRLGPRRLISMDVSGPSQFLEGYLGQVDLDLGNTNQGMAQSTSLSLPEQGALVLKAILVEFLGGTGQEEVRAAAVEPIVQTPSHQSEGFHRRRRRRRSLRSSDQEPTTAATTATQDYHIRYHHYLNGLRVEGASMMLHISGWDGTVFALNGEFAPTHNDTNTNTTITTTSTLSCESAIQLALQQLQARKVQFLSSCTLAAVYGNDGYFQHAWKALVKYRMQGEPSRRVDKIFASPTTGQLVARFPTIHGSRTLETRECRNSRNCQVVSTSSNPITTSNSVSAAARDAHNYAIATYNYFWEEHGRDSIDNKGLKLISRVNYVKEGSYYNNAFWDGSQMTYGNGDGDKYYYFSRALDVVAHELVHGITDYTSELRYQDESGAINEAMSDIFGAVVKRLKSNPRVSIRDTWLLGADVFRNGGSFRTMADPAARGHIDHYSKLYRGDEDNGGVHRNSGVMNLAFVLAVMGGTHPRRASINVKALDKNFDTSLRAAARIWYQANTACLTEFSQFAQARQCTLMFAGNYTSSMTVWSAWDAVGVTGPPLPTPKPTRAPTRRPTRRPSRMPSQKPSFQPTVSSHPTVSIRPTTTTWYPTKAPVITRLSVAKCLQLIQSSCNCSDFINNKSRCWFDVAKDICHLTQTKRKSVRTKWKDFCRQQ